MTMKDKINIKIYRYNSDKKILELSVKSFIKLKLSSPIQYTRYPAKKLGINPNIKGSLLSICCIFFLSLTRIHIKKS